MYRHWINLKWIIAVILWTLFVGIFLIKAQQLSLLAKQSRDILILEDIHLAQFRNLLNCLTKNGHGYPYHTCDSFQKWLHTQAWGEDTFGKWKGIESLQNPSNLCHFQTPDEAVYSIKLIGTPANCL